MTADGRSFGCASCQGPSVFAGSCTSCGARGQVACLACLGELRNDGTCSCPSSLQRAAASTRAMNGHDNGHVMTLMTAEEAGRISRERVMTAERARPAPQKAKRKLALIWS